MLNQAQRNFLLDAARLAVQARLDGSQRLAQREEDAALWTHRGAFVSIHAAGDLRGCIGLVAPSMPLLTTVTHCAVSAAFEDPRFPPLTSEELPSTCFEISVLSVPFRIGRIEDLKAGQHGVIVTAGGTRGLLLPQVASRQNWSIERLLSAACLKAGLARNAWRGSDLEIKAFTAEVFSETSPAAW